MPYTADKPGAAPSTEELKARIPGWGADLDPNDRPGVPREQFAPDSTGAHWDFPERQEEKWPRERSVEHQFLTPVFGTSCPPKGLSGALRKFSYARYSEARAAHWLLLIAADRVDALESHVASLLRGKPDNPLATGIRSEFSHDGRGSRLGQKRADVWHQPLDPIVVAAPWLAGGAAAYKVVTAIRKRRSV